jgi:hypothetical protein
LHSICRQRIYQKHHMTPLKKGALLDYMHV